MATALNKLTEKDKTKTLDEKDKLNNVNSKKEDSGEPPVNNLELLDGLKNELFTEWKEKELKINRVIQTGNFNASKDNPAWYIILPNQTSKRYWDIFACFAGIVNVLIVTVDISWNFECWIGDANLAQIKTVYSVFTGIFCIDVLFNCFTAFLDERNMYIYDLKSIMTNYMKNGLISDILSTTPYYKILSFNISYCFQPSIAPSKWFYFLCFMRIAGINRTFLILEKIFSKLTLAIRFVKLFAFIIFLANLSGNVFGGLSPVLGGTINAYCSSLYAASSNENFACLAEFTYTHFWNIYFYSLFMGFMLTLGTDFTAQTVFEQVFLFSLIIISTIVNASIYGNVAVLLANVSSGVSPILREKIDTMTEYMNFMKFDPKFRDQIKDYHHNIWFKQRNMMYDDSFFGDMSLALQKILLLLQYKPSFFISNKLLPIISPQFILDMVIHLKPKIYMMNDIIITEGESTKEVFFASTTSYCKVYIGGQWVRDLSAGDIFGEIAIFLRSKRRTATILCYKDSDFLHLEGENLQTLLRNYPEDYLRIKTRAVQTFVNSIKFYPSGLFAKLVPNNNLKDYLFRKSIYLEDEEEDEVYNTKHPASLDANEYNEKVSQIIDKLSEVRNNLMLATR